MKSLFIRKILDPIFFVTQNLKNNKIALQYTILNSPLQGYLHLSLCYFEWKRRHKICST